jgi:hypothetical protein
MWSPTIFRLEGVTAGSLKVAGWKDARKKLNLQQYSWKNEF